MKQGQETGLRAGRSLGAAVPEGGDPVLDLGQIEEKVLNPQAGAFADGGQLSGLKVRKSERRLSSPLARERRQFGDNAYQSMPQKIERFAHQDQVGVVGDVTTCRAQMDDVAGAGS